ncbi:MAG: hypothetical protein M1453_03855 [Acidobacteria bacterium]|nr:hypothetical protein [Acidobacteriota bacterium]MCL5287114.1 hypothetical protein [Acidobacteriota bacterium]
MKGIAAVACSLFLLPGGVWAQSTVPPQTPEKTEARFRALEERIRALEEELRVVKAAQTQAPAQSAAPVEVAQAPAPPPALPSYGQIGGAGGSAAKALNPDIGVIGNFIGATGRNQINPLGALSLQESEVSLQAIVDPYARADFFLAIGEEGIEVEEGYVTFTSVPGGFVPRVGRMRAAFGRTNSFHNHSLPWVDRPMVAFNLMGGSLDEADVGIKDAGISVSRILPSPNGLFLEATGELFRGDSGSLFKASRRSDVSVVGHLKAYSDLTENTNLELGGSYGRGHNDLGSSFITQLYGLDATLRWKPLRRAIYRSFAARTELVWSRRDEVTTTQRAFGLFGSLEYRLGRRWFVGGRYDWSERARNSAQHDSGGSFVLTYWPSEFSQIRGQLRRTRYAEGQTANELLLQVLFTIGAHGAHPF